MCVTVSSVSRHDDGNRGNAVLPIYAVTPFTMLDFSGKTACIVWFSGCNMRCAYCHNPQIAKGKGRFGQNRAFDFLESRRGLLDGVVLSGGEATLYTGLVAFAQHIKDMGFAVKLDTNGTRPDIMEKLLTDCLVDYVALDYKAPREKFSTITDCRDWDKFARTITLLTAQKTALYEIRTTVHTHLLDEGDIVAILADLETRGFQGNYYVQNTVQNKERHTLGALPTQPRRLNCDALASTDTICVGFRNF